MGRLATAKLEQQKQTTAKPTKPTYPGFAETGIDKDTWQKQVDDAWDDRSGASKLWDTINIGDSGRSWTTKNPTENKSVGESTKDVGKSLFEGTNRVVQSINALTGYSEKKSQERLEKHNSDIQSINDKLDKDPNNKDLLAQKKKINDAYTADLKKEQEDTAWAGTEDKGTGDRLKKASGVALEALSEWVPVGKGAQAAKLAERGAVVGAKTAAKKGAQEVIEKGGSRLARAKLAAEVGAQQAVVGAAGGAGGALAEDNVDAKEVAKRALTGAATGAVTGAGGTFLPTSLPKGEDGFIANPFYRSGKQSFAPLDEPSTNLINNLEQEAVNTPVAKNTQRVFQVTENDQPTDWVFQDADELANFINGRTSDNMKVNFMDVPKEQLMATGKGDGVFQLKDAVEAKPAAQRNVVAAAEVEPPTVESLSVPVSRPTGTGEAPVQLKVLDDVQREADVRSPGDVAAPAAQRTETKTQKGAQYIVDDIDRLQQESGLDLTPLDRKAAAALTGETRRSNFQEFRDKMGKNFQDTMTYAARSLGKPGTDFVYDMLSGNKFKRDALDALRNPMADLAKLNKKLAGSSLAARRDLGARIGSALDDRTNAAQYLRNEDETQLFDKYVEVFDYVKQLREKSGLEVLENYRPWVNIKEAAEPPTWLAQNVTGKKTQTLSRFSKERTTTEAGENVDNNLADMIYGYVNSQLNEMAYDAPVKKFKGNLDNLSAGTKANVGQMNEGIDYMRQLVEQAVNPERKNPLERAANKLTSNVYSSILPFNVRLAVQNKTQLFVANSRVSKGARSMAKKINETDAKELEKGLVFGDSTVYGQLEDVNATPTGKGKGLVEKVKKVDPYQKSEHENVIKSYNRGAMQAVKDSETYKAAKAQGMKTEDAIHAALQDPEVKAAAIRRGNVVVNDTQFGASPLARPEMLREEGSFWGVLPKKTVYMFSRFPIGMSQHTLEVLDNGNARALEMLKNGDPRGVSIAEMRNNYGALLSSMKDAKKALDKGVDIGIPSDVLNEQIKAVGKNMKVIDAEAKKISQIRGGKTLKNLGKMWAAAAAIQIIFDGGIQSFADDPVGTGSEALSKTNPTFGGRIVGQNSPLAAITSAASPLDRYGSVNERALTNYVPGVGLAVNRGRDIQKIIKNLSGEEDE